MLTACGSTVLVICAAWARKAELTQGHTVNLRRNATKENKFDLLGYITNRSLFFALILTTPRGHVNSAYPCNISCLFVRPCSSFGTRKSDNSDLNSPSHLTMHQPELAGYCPTLAEILYHFNRRRHRNYTILSAVLILLSLVWICGRLALDNSSGRDQSWMTAGHDESSGIRNSEALANHLIPPKIWQILLPKGQSVDKHTVDPKMLQHTASWLAMNEDYQ